MLLDVSDAPPKILGRFFCRFCFAEFNSIQGSCSSPDCFAVLPITHMFWIIVCAFSRGLPQSQDIMSKKKKMFTKCNARVAGGAPPRHCPQESSAAAVFTKCAALYCPLVMVQVTGLASAAAALPAEKKHHSRLSRCRSGQLLAE